MFKGIGDQGIKVSPDTEDVMAAINKIFGRSIIPEDLYGAVSHSISQLGGDAIRLCAGKSLEYKTGFLIGYAAALK